VILAASGGVFHRGIWLRQVLVSRRNLGALPPPATEVMGLSNYVHDPCMVIHGNQVPRRVLIKYIANRRGGFHYGERRGSDLEEHLYTLLDWASETLDLVEQRVPYFAYLASLQAIIWSPDVRHFVEHVTERQLRSTVPVRPWTRASDC
jgi:hypothetical protein